MTPIRNRRGLVRALGCAAALCAAALGQAAPATGPLRVSKMNPRYFSDGADNIIYLTGAHTWNNLQDMGPTDPPPRFDFDAHLDFLENHHHNFIRLWRWELVSWNTAANGQKKSKVHFAGPHPWMRTGPEKALDGKARFDLEKLDDAYFERLHSRAEAAGNRGIYVSIMLFEGWGLQFVADGWKAHPFNPSNNVNSIGKEVNPNGKGLEIFELRVPSVTRVQEAYLRKVIDATNDLDNVLYEISNENHPASTPWQAHMIQFVHDEEAKRPKQHPVGMTFQYQGGSNATLFQSHAEWISPNPDATDKFNYRDNPPPAEGRKVILSDTDHLWGIGGTRDWVWKTFLRGLNPLFMDPYKRDILDQGSDAQWEPVRQAMGDTRRFAQRIGLAAMAPHAELAATGFCLANPGVEYLIYQPKGGESFSVELKPGTYSYDWFDPGKRAPGGVGRVVAPGGPHDFNAPFGGEALLHLKAQ